MITALFRGGVAGVITVGGGLSAAAGDQADSHTILWVSGIGALASIVVALITVLVPPLVRHGHDDDDALIRTLVDKLAKSEHAAALRQQKIEALTAQMKDHDA